MVRGKAIVAISLAIICLMASRLVYLQPVKAQSQNQNITQLIPNPINNVTALDITIQSPLNKTYKDNNITLSFTLNSDAPPFELFSAKLYGLYSLIGIALDYNLNELVNLVADTNLYDSFPRNASISYSELGNDTYIGNATLTNLSQGYHNVTIWAQADASFISWGYHVGYSFATVSFYVDSIPPYVSILTPQNTSYTTSDVPIEFTANKTLSLISYSLDGKDNVTVQGNFSLSSVPNGYHNLTVYAADEAGNTGKQTLNFKVEKPLIDFSTITILVVGIPVAIICLIIGLLLSRRRRRHRKTAKLNK